MSGFQWIIRPLDNADTPAIVALYDRAASFDAGLGPVSSGDWHRFLALPQNLGGRDFRVAFAENRLVGLAESSPRDRVGGKARFFKIVVDPACRLRGIGVALLKELVALDDDPRSEFLTLARPDWTAGAAFLAKLGFAASEEEIAMRLAAPPARVAHRQTEVSIEHIEDVGPKVDALARIHNAAYASDAGFRVHTGDEMAALLASAEVWAARWHGEIIGFCVVEPDAAGLWIESVAIEPERQGQGLGSALLFRILQAAGVGFDRPAALQVSSLQAAAQRVYRRLGFTEISRQIRLTARGSDILARIGRRI